MSKKNKNTVAVVETPVAVVDAPAAVVETPAVAAPVAVTPGKIQIEVKGKMIEVIQIAPGAFQKTNSIFYVRDSVTGTNDYCFPERMKQLLKKYNGDLSQYKNRAAKALERADAKAAVAARKAAKAAAPIVPLVPVVTPVAAEPAPAFADDAAPAFVDEIPACTIPVEA